MASTNHTTNYNLPQWVKTDAFKMEDFNDAFSKIDTRMKSNADAAANAGDCTVLTGSWAGNGSNTRTISLPWAPKCVIILGHHYSSGAALPVVSILTQNKELYIENGGEVGSLENDATLSGSAIQIHSNKWHNYSGNTVYYIAFK